LELDVAVNKDKRTASKHRQEHSDDDFWRNVLFR
jgi:hypothetical protein